MLLRLWILLCATLVAGGWILSLFRALNAAGYAVVLVLFVLGAFANARFLGLDEPWHLRRKLRRFLSWRRPLPFLFAAMSVVLLVRGLVIAPFHSDAMSYRIPRILNWIAEGHWYWIDAQDPRLNTRGVNSEWITLPLLLTWKWDQLIFIPNWISFLFFPRLIFHVWRDWGVSARATWLWMWLLPAGFCYSLQACNASSDILGTFFALAAFAFLRRRPAIPPADLLCSILGIALASGVKLTMAPLGLPWLILLYARRAAIFRWPWLSLAAGAWAALISFIPNVAANLIYVGDVSGLSLEHDVLKPVPYVYRFIGNVYLLILDNLSSPMVAHIIRPFVDSTPPGPMILQRFEPHALFLYPFFSVEQEGIGLIVLSAGAVIFALAWRRRNEPKEHSRLFEDPIALALHASMWLLVFSFLWVNTATQGARLVSGYYPYLIATLFGINARASVVRATLTRQVAAVGIIGTIFCIITLTDYPLYNIHKPNDDRGVLAKRQVQVLGTFIPPTEKSIGIIRYWNEWESWAWKPYGIRRVYELPGDPAPSDLARKNIHYIIVTADFLQMQAETIGAWTAAHHAIVVGETLKRLDKDHTTGCYYVKLDSAAAANPPPAPTPD